MDNIEYTKRLEEILTNYYRKTVRVDGNTPNSRQRAKQAILSDLLEIIPKEVDTKKYKCDDSEYSFMLGYIQACIEIEEKVKKYCE